jgi:SAM-dependent methyltransferase
MTVESFFHLFLKELESNRQLWSYYKFHTDPGSFEFRKAYFCQRLHYVLDHIGSNENTIWDVGCGYGTTALFLVLNGYRVHGTTLEFYYKELPARMEYWSRHGDVSGFTFDYEDLFDRKMNRGVFDRIIVQDTLHHLEPLAEALAILHSHLKTTGEVIVIEENGNNIIQSLKLYRQRGNKRVIEFHDERLNKTILLGNENIRSLKTWKQEFNQQGMDIDADSVHYVRALPPSIFNRLGYDNAVAREQRLWRKNPLLREFFFFGINFIARHAENHGSPNPKNSAMTSAQAI